MEPITAAVVKAGASWLGSKFKTLVIERWARRRAEAFFETFVRELADVDNMGQPLSNIEPMLAKMLDDEIKSEVLFDAYRRVSLSASPSVGPRIIAVLTARIIGQTRTATPEEERLMMVAETFKDDELHALCKYLSEASIEKFEVIISDETEDSTYSSEISIGPVDIADIGNWCVKLQNCGLVVQDLAKKSTLKSDLDRRFSGPGTVTEYLWKLRFQPEVFELKNIIESLRGQ